jgi:hypothetical protein
MRRHKVSEANRKVHRAKAARHETLSAVSQVVLLITMELGKQKLDMYSKKVTRCVVVISRRIIVNVEQVRRLNDLKFAS